jgi:hypothetical protein
VQGSLERAASTEPKTTASGQQPTKAQQAAAEANAKAEEARIRQEEQAAWDPDLAALAEADARDQAEDELLREFARIRVRKAAEADRQVAQDAYTQALQERAEAQAGTKLAAIMAQWTDLGEMDGVAYHPDRYIDFFL